MSDDKKFDPYHSDHKALYDLLSEIEAKVHALSDEDIYYSYWSNYESEQGVFESAVASEFRSRHLDTRR